jgi:hypothetical protein
MPADTLPITAKPLGQAADASTPADKLLIDMT